MDRTAATAETRAPATQAQSRAVQHGWTGDPRDVLGLQRLVGNQAIVAMLSEDVPAAAEDGEALLVVTEEYVADPGGASPDSDGSMLETAPGERSGGFVDRGMVGTAVFGEPADPRHALCPHAFADGGRTGTVPWAGGGGAGARGNEFAGSLQTQVPPTFTASAGPGAGRFSSAITAGTGQLSVTRSWLGVVSGAQGNGRWVSVAAAALINAHETHHVASTRALYTTHLTPVETRIANPALGQNAGASGADAIAAHRTTIGWQPGINAFQSADIAANGQGGTVDTADIAAGWVQNIGAGTVSGVAYTHRTVTTTEAAPPP